MSSKSVPPVAHCEVSELHTVAQKEAAEKKPPAYLKSMECCLVYLFCLPPKIILRPVLSQLSINFTSKSYFYLILIQGVDSVKSIERKIFFTEKPRKPYGSGVSYVWTQWCHSTPILTYTQCCTSTSHCSLLIRNYSMIVATRPDPTVLPPSRIAKVRPCSIAIGWISSMVISTLSPGMHISVPAGSSQTPVTSVVLK